MFRSVPFHRLSAPFGWESHPSSFGSDARSDSSHGRALPAARLVVEPACGRLLASCPPKRERCRVGTALRRLGLSASPWRGAVVRLDPADVILAIRASRLEPRGSPHPRLPVKAPEDDDFPFALRPDVRLVRVVDDRLALSTLARRERSRQLFLCNQQFSMSTRQLLRFPICWRRAFRSPPCPGFPLRGGKGRLSSYGRRIAVAGDAGSDGGMVGPRRRSRSGGSRSRPAIACRDTTTAARAASSAGPCRFSSPRTPLFITTRVLLE